MMPTLQVRHLTLGSGRPAIIVPLVGNTEEEVLRAARAAAQHPHIDLLEWRADYYLHALSADKTCAFLQALRQEIDDKPLLYTFRTALEGGEKSISPVQYAALYEAVAQSALVDLMDVEMLRENATDCVSICHRHGVPVVGSWHDFSQTPDQETLLQRFLFMEEQGADVLKIAVMPQSSEDVHCLMAAANDAHKHTSHPICAISMGALGRITRTNGAQFGSCMTFGVLTAASAPGQIDVDTLYQALMKIS